MKFDYKSYFFKENEEPLESIKENGGFTAIFRKIGYIGDSLSSGEMQCKDPFGNTHYNDYFEYSVGQYIARMCGSLVYNFSRGGMTAKEYMTGFGENSGFFDKEKACQAYVIALGWNDIFNCGDQIGSVDDINDDNPSANADTFAGWYGKVVAKYKEISPDAKFFFVTLPKDCTESFEKAKAHSDLLNELAKHYPNAYVIDLVKYGPDMDPEYRDYFNLEGHRNPMGYMFHAMIISSYIDWIIRHNMNDFKRVGYINTPLADSEIEKMRIAASK